MHAYPSEAAAFSILFATLQPYWDAFGMYTHHFDQASQSTSIPSVLYFRKSARALPILSFV